MNPKKTIALLILVISIFSLPFWAIPYKVTFAAEDGTTIWPAESHKFTDDIDLPGAEKENYIFDGWYDGNRPFSGGKLLGNRTLTAKYSPKMYSIHFQGDENTDLPYGIRYQYGASFTLPEAKKDHFEFLGWREVCNSDGMTETETITTRIKPGEAGDRTYSAVFTPETYTITYVLNGGTAGKNSPAEYTYGTNPEISNPTRPGYDFSGWYTDEELKTKFSYSETDTFGDLTLYAGWRKITVPSYSSMVAKRESASPGCYIGNYYAPIAYSSYYASSGEWQRILDSSCAMSFKLPSGAEWLGDHNTQGFDAMLQYNTLIIVRNGSVETYQKVSTHYSVGEYDWQTTDGIWIPTGTGAYPLVTQTCTYSGGRKCVAFCFWRRV